jgi:hypothetical protein
MKSKTESGLPRRDFLKIAEQSGIEFSASAGFSSKNSAAACAGFGDCHGPTSLGY